MRLRVGLVGLLVALAALAAYAPVLSNKFVNHDERWIFGGGAIREGRISQMLVPQPDLAGYMPVGYLILTGVFHAGGARLFPFHLVSLLLHAANAALLFFLILLLMRRAGGESASLEPGRLFCAGLSAVIFAVHPIHAEGIAVASSLGDLAASFFALASLLCYVRAATDGVAAANKRLSAASIVFAALSGLSRWTAAGRPAILLILDAYPLKRFGRRALLEKIPYFAISLLVVAANTYAKLGLTSSEGVYRLAVQPGGMSAGVVFYIWKWLVPGEYSLYYVLDRPAELMGLPPSGCAVLLFAAVAALVWARRRAPAALAAFGVHLVAVLPVLVTTVNGWVQAHNRYAYLSGMALSAAAAGGLLEAWKRRSLLSLVVLAVVITAGVGFGSQSRGMASEWHDKSRLSSSTLSTDPDAFFSYNRLGEAMLRRGDYKTAVMQFREQLYSHPDDAHARRRLAEFVPFVLAADLNDEGVALVRAQAAAAAVARFERAIAVRPDFIVPYKNLAAVLPGLNRHAEARAYRERAVRLEARSSRR
ncbi:MAG: hypothetical protein ABL955_10435 [Elusimicrobiota bacterium]